MELTKERTKSLEEEQGSQLHHRRLCTWRWKRLLFNFFGPSWHQLAYDQAGAIGLEVECVPDRVAEMITKKVNLLTLSMGSGPNCDVEFLFIQDVIGTNTDRVPRHAKVFKDTNKSYEKLLEDTVEGIKSFVNDVNNKKFPTPKNIVTIDDKEYEKFLDRIEKL